MIDTKAYDVWKTSPAIYDDFIECNKCSNHYHTDAFLDDINGICNHCLYYEGEIDIAEFERLEDATTVKI